MSASHPVSLRPRRLLRLTTCLWLLLFGNELVTAVAGMAEKFAGAKVMISLTDELSGVGLLLAGQAAVMLLLAAGLAALPCLLMASALLATRVCLARALAPARWRRWLFWAVTIVSFLNAWYALHGYLLPGSDLADSWVAAAVGAPRWPTGGSAWTAPRLITLALSLPVTVGVLALALGTDRQLRRRVLLCAAALVACSLGYAAARRPGTQEQFTAPGSVVLLGVDSLQANRLALGGGSPDVAPRMDAFLEGAFRFDNAWTPFARTYPSWISILSGRFPARHGVRFNLSPDDTLAPDVEWLPARLAQAGYSTLHATDECRFSLIRKTHGFDRLLHPPMGSVDFMLGSMFDFSVANLARQTRLGHDLFPAIAHNRASRSYHGDLFAEDVIAALDKLPRNEPVFAVVHLCGDHYPFSTHWPYARMGRDPVEASLAMVDGQVGALLDWMEASGLSRTATTFLLSDHGDGWSGHSEDVTNEHGDDLDEAIANKVVLAARGPGLTAGVANDLVRTLDLYPTVLEAAGLHWDPLAVDGRPLQPWLAGDGTGEAPRALFAESGIGRKVFGMKRLVQEHIDWYAMDPRTGLVFLRPEGVAEFMPHKSYMLLEGDVRLVVTPSLDRFRLHRVDLTTGADLPGQPELPGPARAEMLARLLAHNGLDTTSLTDLARAKGFLD